MAQGIESAPEAFLGLLKGRNFGKQLVKLDLSNEPRRPAMDTTHEVFNQPAPLAGYNLFETNRPLRDALKFNAPQLQLAPLAAPGRRARQSAEMQTHARLANVNPPELHTHDRFGRRIDEVEFHPELPRADEGGGRVQACTARRGPASRASPHVQRAAGFMLFTELEPSILCPISMTYAVTPALRGNAAIYADWGPKLASRWYDPALKPWRDKPGLTMGMGMTEKQGGSDVRANTTRAVRAGSDAWGERYRDHRPQVVLLGADVRCLPGAGAGAGRPHLLLPAARAAGRQAATRSASSA